MEIVFLLWPEKKKGLQIIKGITFFTVLALPAAEITQLIDEVDGSLDLQKVAQMPDFIVNPGLEQVDKYVKQNKLSLLKCDIIKQLQTYDFNPPAPLPFEETMYGKMVEKLLPLAEPFLEMRKQQMECQEKENKLRRAILTKVYRGELKDVTIQL